MSVCWARLHREGVPRGWSVSVPPKLRGSNLQQVPSRLLQIPGLFMYVLQIPRQFTKHCIISTFIWFSEWSWTWFNFWLLLFQPVTVTGMARLGRLVSSCLDSVSVDPLLMVWAVTSVKMDSTTTQCVKVIYYCNSTACQNSSVSLQHWKLWMKVYIWKGVFSNFRV